MNEIEALLKRFFSGVQGTYWASINDRATERDHVEMAVRAASGVDVGGVESIDLHPLAIMALYDAAGDEGVAWPLFLAEAIEYFRREEGELVYFKRWMDTHPD